MSEVRIAELLQAVPVPKGSILSSVRLQWIVRRGIATSAEAADVLVALVTPSALIAFVMGLWRLTADLAWTDTFPISTGFFSHWQVWIALAIGLKFGASVLAAKLSPPAEAGRASGLPK